MFLSIRNLVDVAARAQWAFRVILVLNVLAVGFMAYFAYVQVALIHAICSLCAFAAALNVAIGILILGVVFGRGMVQVR